MTLEAFVKATIRAKELGFFEIRLHEDSIQNLYHLLLYPGYRIDTWLVDKEINSDLRDSFKEIIATFPLLTNGELIENELYERSEFHKEINNVKLRVYGLGAAHVYGTLSVSLLTHEEWLKTNVSIQHYAIDHEANETTLEVNTLNFSSKQTLELHINWIENEQKESLKKSIDLWSRREEYFPNIILGTDIENQFKKIGLTKKLNQVFDSLKKLDSYAKTWVQGGFNLNALKDSSLMDISGESACTMQKYSTLRKFRLANGQKAQFELHIKIPQVRIYFLPDEETHKITVGYIGKHIRTCLFD
ncbi:MAG: hypothetical protein H0W61_17265 [Bacteroidetes bacterium]|nr:hypothetical protein [Bacteroidota bacterium]